MNQRQDQPTPSFVAGQNGSQPKEMKNTAKKAKLASSTASTKSDNKVAEVRLKVAAVGVCISAEERQRLTQEIAYLFAEKRGFSGGDAVADWLEAEAEVNSRFPQ